MPLVLRRAIAIITFSNGTIKLITHLFFNQFRAVFRCCRFFCWYIEIKKTLKTRRKIRIMTKFTWHLRYTERTGKRFDFPSTIVCKMPQSILFHVHCIANRLVQVMSSRIWLDLFHLLLIRMSIQVVEMLVWMQFDQDMVDSKTNSIAHSSLSRSLLCVLVGYLLR